MWIARDKNGSLWLYDTKPIKGDVRWIMANTTGGCCKIEDDDYFPIRIWKGVFLEVKWEDEEPRELILKPINEE